VLWIVWSRNAAKSIAISRLLSYHEPRAALTNVSDEDENLAPLVQRVYMIRGVRIGHNGDNGISGNDGCVFVIEYPKSWGFQTEGLAAHRIAPFNQRGKRGTPSACDSDEALEFLVARA